ncbi:hypothetical protein SALBM311S_08243 [Streptomyces alboniger]
MAAPLKPLNVPSLASESMTTGLEGDLDALVGIAHGFHSLVNALLPRADGFANAVLVVGVVVEGRALAITEQCGVVRATPWSETFMPLAMASSRSDSSLLRRSTNCAYASRSSPAIAVASVWAFWNSFRVMAKRLLAASALSPVQVGPRVMPWTSRLYAFPARGISWPRLPNYPQLW